MNNLKLKYHWFKQDLKRFYYKFMYNIKMDLFKGSILPSCGKGLFVDVIKRGEIIDIINHSDIPSVKRGTIRLIPCQSNHGVMVEFINEEGRMQGRTSCDYRRFYEMVSGSSESDMPTQEGIKENEKPHPMLCFSHGGSGACEEVNKRHGFTCPKCKAAKENTCYECPLPNQEEKS